MSLKELSQVGSYTYFDHQEVAIRWMLNLEETPFKMLRPVHGGILADDMGLGKTLEIIGLIHNSPAKHTLLLCPLALIDNWTNMARAADMTVFTFGKQGWTVLHKSPSATKTVFVTNYEKLLQDSNIAYFCGPEWDRVVLDEAHRIRNPKTALYKRCMKVKSTTGRWAVTGTPVVNSLNDAAALLKWCGVNASAKWDDKIHTRISPHLVLHRSLKQMRSIIKGAPPEPIVEQIVLPFKTHQEGEFYKGIQGIIKSQLDDWLHDNHSQAEILALLLRLRQISVHPQVYINGKRRANPHYSRPDWTLPVTKFEAIADQIKGDTTDGPHKYIFICHFKDEIALLKEYMEKHSLVTKVTTYDGSMTQVERRESINELEAAQGSAAMLLQLQAGGVGLNLQCCDRVVFLSPWWTAALMDQAIARAVRMGQMETVKVWHVCLEEEQDDLLNIDNYINSRATYKRALADWFFSIVHRQAITKMPTPPAQVKRPATAAIPAIAQTTMVDAEDPA
jgi:SNF2 family DNA or RNA helicase